jgi:signal transduction histidine kinase
MASEPATAHLPLETAATLAQLRHDNERLHARVQQLEDEARAVLVLQEIAHTLSAELRLPTLLRRIAAAALRLTAGQGSIVYLLDPQRGALTVEAAETLASASSSTFSRYDPAEDSQPGAFADSDAGEPHRGMPLGEGIAGAVAATESLVLLADAEHDARFTAEALAVDGDLLGVRPTSLVAVPMIFNGIVTGVLEVAQTAGGPGFDARSLDLMSTLAAQAATAVANAQLYRRLRRERDRIIQTQEDERKRLGRDLHDGPAQKLAQIVMSLDFAEQLATREPQRLPQELRTIREQAQSTTREIRNFLFDLRPLVLDSENGGLVAALGHFLERFRDAPAPKMHLSAEYPERLVHNTELTVFAILQEAVSNVLKHGNAQNCWIELRETPERLVATVRDDGSGFDVQKVRTEYESRGSWGLLSMLERAALIDGRLQVVSQPGKGALVTLDVPRYAEAR